MSHSIDPDLLSPISIAISSAFSGAITSRQALLSFTSLRVENSDDTPFFGASIEDTSFAGLIKVGKEEETGELRRSVSMIREWEW